METRKASVNRASSLEISGPHSILHQTSEREERLSKCFTYIFVTFAVCFTPWAILTTVDPIPPSTLGWLHMATYILSWSSAFINPIIYSATNRNYQGAFKQLLGRIIPGGSARASVRSRKTEETTAMELVNRDSVD